MDNYDNWLIKCYTKKEPEGGQTERSLHLPVTNFTMCFNIPDDRYR